MKKLVGTLSAVFLTLALASCGSLPTSVSGDTPTADGTAPDGTSPGGVAPSALPEGMGSTAADDVFPRTVGHFAGSTTINAAPTRVAAISTGQLDGLLTIGVVPIGTTTARGAGLVPDYVKAAFPDHGRALAAMASLGTRSEPDVEAVAAADPDLILTNSTVDETVRAQFARIAPVVVTEGTGVNWKQDFLLLADAVGKRESATSYLATFQQDAADLGQRVEGEPTVSVTSVAPDRIRVFGVGSFAGSIVADAGLRRPTGQDFDDTSIDISMESLDRAGADWIFYGVQGTTAEVTTSSLWRALPAVTAGQAVEVDYDTWFLNAGPTAARLLLTDLQTSLDS